MNIKSQLTVLISSTLFAVGGLAMGSSLNVVASDRVIYGCVTGINGNITKVSNVAHSCPRGSTPISWNEQGPTGAKGETGPAGPTGPEGPAGKINSSNGLVPWYLANADGSASITPINFSLIPDGTNRDVAVMIQGVIASLDVSTGRVKSSFESGDIEGALFIGPNCAGVGISPNALPKRYQTYPDGSKAFVGNGQRYRISEVISANSTILYSTIYNYFSNYGVEDPIVRALDFGTESEGCLTFTQVEMANFFFETFTLNNPYPSRGTAAQKTAWENRKQATFESFANTEYSGIAEVAPIPSFGPLHVVSNY